MSSALSIDDWSKAVASLKDRASQSSPIHKTSHDISDLLTVTYRHDEATPTELEIVVGIPALDDDSIPEDVEAVLTYLAAATVNDLIKNASATDPSPYAHSHRLTEGIVTGISSATSSAWDPLGGGCNLPCRQTQYSFDGNFDCGTFTKISVSAETNRHQGFEGGATQQDRAFVTSVPWQRTAKSPEGLMKRRPEEDADGYHGGKVFKRQRGIPATHQASRIAQGPSTSKEVLHPSYEDHEAMDVDE